jgi:photosystem II stability/assembly factor-like uncharacterized protein
MPGDGNTGPWLFFLGISQMTLLKKITLSPLLAMMAWGISLPAFGIDLLELPAVQSKAASRALLLDVADRGDGVAVAVGTFGVIVVSEDGGANWAQSQVPASVTLTGVHFPTPEKGWAVGHDGLILHSSDGGATWQKQLDGHQLNEQIVAVAERIVEQVRGALEALQAREDADEYDIEDAEFMLEEAEFALEGAMDDISTGPVRPLLDVWFRNEREGFVIGSYGMLLVTDNGGQDWTLVSDRMDNAEAFHLNQITPTPDGKLFIAGEAGFVYRSTDGGMSWDTLEPGYEGSFYGIVAVPDGAGGYELLAYGLRGNLFRSIDAGDSWESLDSGTAVTLMSGALLEDGTVFLGGQGGTILVREPGARNFSPVANPNRNVISGLEQMPDGKVLLVGLGGVRMVAPDGMPTGNEEQQ